MLRFSILLLFLFPSVVSAQQVWWEGTYAGRFYPGRWYSENSLCCGRSNCPMRQDILGMIAQKQAQMQVQAAQSAPVVQQQVQVPQVTQQAYRTETRQVPVTRQVKRCNGRQCWYESVTTYKMQTFRIPIETPLPAAAPSTPVVKPSLDLLTVTELKPTPQTVVSAMLELMHLYMGLDEESKVFDLGCGDGRFLTTAAKYYGASGFGVELNPESVELARRNAELDFVSPMVTIFEGDVREFDVSEATHITMYLYPDLMAEVLPRIKPGTVIASYLHPIAGIQAESHSLLIEGQTHEFYVGTKR